MQRIDSDPIANSPLKISDFINRPFAICCILLVAHEVCGVFTMINYAAKIFKDAGSSLKPGDAAMIVGAIQLIGSYTSSILIDRLGRKVKLAKNFAHINLQIFNDLIRILFLFFFSLEFQILMVVSFAGTAICHAVFATYVYLKEETTIDVTPFNWVPLVAFATMIFIAACGAMPVPYVLLGEILPDKVSSMIYIIPELQLFYLIFFLFTIIDSKSGNYIRFVRFMGSDLCPG